MTEVLISLVISYLIGSLNGAMLASKLKGGDIRKEGSGNAGATNALRVYGKGVAAAVFIFDFLKAVAAILICRLVFKTEGAELAAAAGVVLGHNFPLYFGFRGGKGITTSFAAVLMIEPLAAAGLLLVFIVVCAASRMVSLSSILSAFSLPIIHLILTKGAFDAVFWVFTALALLAIARHHSNIKRILSGTENRLGGKKK